MIVKTMGLFWQEQDVFWGRQKNRGQLLGLCGSPKKNDSVDFRDQRGIYVLWNSNLEPLYIGQAGSGKRRLFDRLKDHRSPKDPLSGRWKKFSWFGVLGVGEDFKLEKDEDGGGHELTVKVGAVLDQLEALLITVTEPGLNRQGGKWGKDIQVFEQVRHPKLAPSKDDMIRKIYESLPSK
jgi:hypothetical protein